MDSILKTLTITKLYYLGSLLDMDQKSSRKGNLFLVFVKYTLLFLLSVLRYNCLGAGEKFMKKAFHVALVFQFNLGNVECKPLSFPKFGRLSV